MSNDAAIFEAKIVCCREKLQSAEAKVRGLVQDKAAAVAEKGNLERELKSLKSTTGQLTKVGSLQLITAVQLANLPRISYYTMYYIPVYIIMG